MVNRECMETSVRFLERLCDYPYTMKHWRNLVTDIFFDQDFFNQEPQQLAHWQSPINQLIFPTWIEFNSMLLNFSFLRHQKLCNKFLGPQRFLLVENKTPSTNLEDCFASLSLFSLVRWTSMQITKKISEIVY